MEKFLENLKTICTNDNLSLATCYEVGLQKLEKDELIIEAIFSVPVNMWNEVDYSQRIVPVTITIPSGSFERYSRESMLYATSGKIIEFLEQAVVEFEIKH